MTNLELHSMFASSASSFGVSNDDACVAFYRLAHVCRQTTR